MSIKKTSFGKTAAGQEAALFTIVNANGLILKLTDYGATVVAMETPDRSGKLANVNLGFDSVAGYEGHTAYFGATVGRYANRIAKGRFTLGGQEYVLATNNGPNHLHGGRQGFNAQFWQAEETSGPDFAGVKFTLKSPDGQEGYPGALDAVVTYTLNAKNELTIDYVATTDKPTVLNLTNHCYWNLGGVGSGDVLNHEVTVAADKFVEAGEGLIPTGKLVDVKGTALDFTSPLPVGKRIAELKTDPSGPRGYDHCYVLRGQGGKLALAARVQDPKSGRVLEISTTQPGIQLYTGNFLDGDAKNGGHAQHAALCLETQHYPDSPNRPEFPSVALQPGEKFHETTVHRFFAEVR